MDTANHNNRDTSSSSSLDIIKVAEVTPELQARFVKDYLAVCSRIKQLQQEILPLREQLQAMKPHVARVCNAQLDQKWQEVLADVKTQQVFGATAVKLKCVPPEWKPGACTEKVIKLGLAQLFDELQQMGQETLPQDWQHQEWQQEQNRWKKDQVARTETLIEQHMDDEIAETVVAPEVTLDIVTETSSWEQVLTEKTAYIKTLQDMNWQGKTENQTISHEVSQPMMASSSAVATREQAEGEGEKTHSLPWLQLLCWVTQSSREVFVERAWHHIHKHRTLRQKPLAISITAVRGTKRKRIA